MQEVVANLDHVKFDLEYAIDRQLGVQPLPFTGMDSKLKKTVLIYHLLILTKCKSVFLFNTSIYCYYLEAAEQFTA